MDHLSENRPDSDSYKTFARTSEGIFKDRGSKFLYFGFPVSSEDEIKTILASLRKTYYDASHHCYAWILGKEGKSFRANDDGEPNHSAGDPILGQIRSKQLTDALIVVVRYFGGTKLGVSGLIQAYKTAAALAIEANEIVEKLVKYPLELSFPYPAMNEVKTVIKSQNLEIIAQEMSLSCKITLSVRASLIDSILEKMLEINQLSIKSD